MAFKKSFHRDLQNTCYLFPHCPCEPFFVQVAPLVSQRVPRAVLPVVCETCEKVVLAKFSQRVAILVFNLKYELPKYWGFFWLF
jgi:hypothetical protein